LSFVRGQKQGARSLYRFAQRPERDELVRTIRENPDSSMERFAAGLPGKNSAPPITLGPAIAQRKGCATRPQYLARRNKCADATSVQGDLWSINNIHA